MLRASRRSTPGVVPIIIHGRLLKLGMTRAREWADKVERAASDPDRIERRKRITPAITTSLRAGVNANRTVAYLPAETLAAMEASETTVPESHVIRAKELRAKFLR